MNQRYLPQNLKSTQEVELIMLPGITFESDAIYIGGLKISKLDFFDWHLMEKSQFTDDLVDYMISDNQYFFVFTSENFTNEDAIIKYRSNSRQYSVILFTRALRLFYSGRIESPNDFINYKRMGSTNIRDPKRFGRMSYNILKSINVKDNELQVLEGLFYSISLYENTRRNHAITFSFHLFDRSYDLTLKKQPEQALFLLGSIEALLGKHINALVNIPWSKTEITDFCKNYRKNRNSLAHGKADSSLEHIEILREIARVLLREAISHQLLFPDSEEATGKALAMRLSNPDYQKPQRLANLQAKYDGFISKNTN